MNFEDAVKAADNAMNGWVSEVITDDRETWAGETSGVYLVEALSAVRTALIEDYENEDDDATSYEGEDTAGFLDRHGIDWE